MTGLRRAGRAAALALAVLWAIPAAGAPAGGVELLRDFTIALPRGGGTSARLLVAPPPEAAVERLGPASPRFAVGPGHAAWLWLEPGVLLQATRGWSFDPGVALTDLAVLEGGGLVVATAASVGALVPERDASAPSAGGRVTFQPIADHPLAGARLAAAVGGGLYLFGTLREGGGQAVYLLAPEAAGPGEARALRTLRRVFSSTEPIAAVAGDGRDTFVAVGKQVVKVSGAGPGLEPVLLAKEPVTGLALAPRGLLIYATASGVGRAAPGPAFEFVRARGAVPRVAGDALYLLLRGAWAVVVLEGLDPLSRTR